MAWIWIDTKEDVFGNGMGRHLVDGHCEIGGLRPVIGDGFKFLGDCLLVRLFAITIRTCRRPPKWPAGADGSTSDLAAVPLIGLKSSDGSSRSNQDAQFRSHVGAFRGPFAHDVHTFE